MKTLFFTSTDFCNEKLINIGLKTNFLDIWELLINDCYKPHISLLNFEVEDLLNTPNKISVKKYYCSLIKLSVRLISSLIVDCCYQNTDSTGLTGWREENAQARNDSASMLQTGFQYFGAELVYQSWRIFNVFEITQAKVRMTGFETRFLSGRSGFS